jgi:hypothetical protein
MILNCDFCFKEFETNPIILPCGWTVCEQHLKNRELLKCRFCIQKHEYEPNKHVNMKVLTLLNKEKQARKLKELEQSVEEFKTVFNDPEYYIDNIFRELIDKMQQRKEETLESIKNYFENEIDKIEERKASLLQRLKQDEEFIRNMKKLSPNEILNGLNQLKKEKTNQNTEGKINRQ